MIQISTMVYAIPQGSDDDHSIEGGHLKGSKGSKGSKRSKGSTNDDDDNSPPPVTPAPVTPSPSPVTPSPVQCAIAETITFDEFDTTSTHFYIPDGYHGLDWNQYRAKSRGLNDHVNSIPNVAFLASSNFFASQNGEVFKLMSLYSSIGRHHEYQTTDITYQGWRNGAIVATHTVTQTHHYSGPSDYIVFPSAFSVELLDKVKIIDQAMIDYENADPNEFLFLYFDVLVDDIVLSICM